MISEHVKIIRSLNSFQPKNVFEIGSRDGHDAVYYASEFRISDDKVYVFEPNPPLALYIKNLYPGINVLETAISNIEGELLFNCAKIKEQSTKDDWMTYGISSLSDRDDYNDLIDGVEFNKILVNVTRMAAIIEKFDIEGIDICKIDVEGNTFEVLESFRDKLKIVKSFHLEMEYIPYWNNQVLAPQIKSYLQSNGFTMMYEKYINNAKQTDSVWINNDFLGNTVPQQRKG